MQTRALGIGFDGTLQWRFALTNASMTKYWQLRQEQNPIRTINVFFGRQVDKFPLPLFIGQDDRNLATIPAAVLASRPTSGS